MVLIANFDTYGSRVTSYHFTFFFKAKPAFFQSVALHYIIFFYQG